jgi:tetratricopeptide (TPR) repeat protein
MHKPKNAYGLLETLLMVPLCSVAFMAYGQVQTQGFEELWEAFESGQDVEEQVDLHLVTGINDPHQQARFFYLKGHLLKRDPNLHQEAIDYLQLARQYYLDENSFEGIMRTNSGLAEIYLSMGRHVDAELALENNLQLAGENNLPLGNTLSLLVILAFEQRDIPRALEYCDQGAAAFDEVGYSGRAAYSRFQKGLIQILTGQRSPGYQEVLWVQSINGNQGNELKHVYTLTAMALYHRCQNMHFEPLVTIVQEYLETKNNWHLREVLDFVLQADCGSQPNASLIIQDPPPPPPATPRPPP